MEQGEEARCTGEVGEIYTTIHIFKKTKIVFLKTFLGKAGEKGPIG
jgi:hypothetical protein